MNFKHTGCIGDLIYFLPVIRFYGGGSLFIDTTELSVKKINEPIIQWPPPCPLELSRVKTIRCGMDEKKYLSLKPLLEIQPYIQKLDLWSGWVFSPIDCHNNVPFLIHVFPGKPKNKNLCHFFLDFHKVPVIECNTPWIKTDISYENNDKIIVSRSFRYRNENFPWQNICKKFKDKIYFIGDLLEYDDFCKNFGKVKYIETVNFLEVARHLSNCRLFIGNQSSCYAIAEAMKIRTIQETCSYCPDCIFERDTAEYFVSKEKLLNSKNISFKLWN